MKSNVIKYIFIIIIAVLLIFAVYKMYDGKDDKNGVSNGNGSSQPKEITKEIKLAIASVDTINPILSKNKNVQDIDKLIFEPLVNITQNFKAEPCLAIEWAKSDGNSYILKLRENVKWSNGEKFNGEDVRFTIDKLKELPSIYSSNVQYVIGVDVIDDYTVKINLDRDVPFFEYNLTFPILSRKYYEGENFAQTEKNNTPVSTGMFKISEETESNYIIEKNDNWWNLSNKNFILEKIIVNKNSSMGEVYNAFKMGNVDFVNTANLNYQNYIGTLGYSTKEYYAREHGFLALNTQSALLSDLAVRQAISGFIDKNNIIASVYAGNYYASDFPLAFGSWLDDKDNSGVPFNSEYANNVLQEAGWDLIKGNWQRTVNYKIQKLNLNLLVKSSNANCMQIANVIQAQLAQYGVVINIRAVSDAQYNASLASKDYDILLGVTDVSASPNLTTYFGESNMANYTSAEVSSIIQEVSNSTDENVLKEKYKRLKEIYKTEVPYISLYFSKNIAVYNTSLAGEVSPNWFNPFYNVENWYK